MLMHEGGDGGFYNCYSGCATDWDRHYYNIDASEYSSLEYYYFTETPVDIVHCNKVVDYAYIYFTAILSSPNCDDDIPFISHIKFSRQQVAQTPPPTYLSSEDNRDTIGLAISRPRSEVIPIRQEAQPERKYSRLLPAKPTLTLAIPPQATASGLSSQKPPPADRASTMTNMTAFADLDTEAAESGHIWRPPPMEPQSATAYYVADPRGNWVLRDDNRKSEVEQVAQAAELDTYTPLTKSPIEKQEEEAAAMAGAISAATSIPKKPRPAFLLRDDPSMSRSSSLYSQASAVRQRPPPPPARRSSSSSQKGVRAGVRRSDSKDSHASATTINTSSPSPFDDDAAIEDEIARLSQLSPVAESPSPRSGRPRVRYPKITGRLDGATIRHVPPPKRPNFSSSPPGQPSPTLGTALPTVTGSPSAYPPPLRPKPPNRAPGPAPLQSTGSGFSPAPPSEVAFPQSQQQQQQSQRPQPRPLQQQQPSRRPQTPPQQQQQQQQQQMQSPAPVPAPPRLDTLQAQGRRSPHIASQIAVASPVSTTTPTTSAAGSLLAKRVGSDKAAALALDSNPAGSGKHWRRRQGAGEPGLLSPETAAAGLASPRDPPAGLGSGTLPTTPTWQPKLTPTRRGDDLFLNVQ
ncbi:hypothetical protein DL768_006861 [Monosporascus sp. mg162]|nr:hypothetical protein DL768_006861 [Monosporascus sp. mg162]